MAPGVPVRLRSELRWSDIIEPLPPGLCGYVADLPAHDGHLPVDFGAEMGGVYQVPEALLELDLKEAADMARDGLERRDVLEQPDQSGQRVIAVGGRIG